MSSSLSAPCHSTEQDRVLKIIFKRETQTKETPTTTFDFISGRDCQRAAPSVAEHGEDRKMKTREKSGGFLGDLDVEFFTQSVV